VPLLILVGLDFTDVLIRYKIEIDTRVLSSMTDMIQPYIEHLSRTIHRASISWYLLSTLKQLSIYCLAIKLRLYIPCSAYEVCQIKRKK